LPTAAAAWTTLAAAGRAYDSRRPSNSLPHVTAQLRRLVTSGGGRTTVVRKSEYVTGRPHQLLSGNRRQYGYGPLGPPPQVNAFGLDDDGEQRPCPGRRRRHCVRACAHERFGPSAAILYTALRSPLHTTPHGHPILITRTRARARPHSLQSHIRRWCNKRTH